MDADSVLQTGCTMTEPEMDWEEEDFDDIPQALEEDEEDVEDAEEEINWDDEDLG